MDSAVSLPCKNCQGSMQGGDHGSGINQGVPICRMMFDEPFVE